MSKGIIETDFIQLLLARLDIVDLIGSFMDLKKAGRNYTGLCPFHNEKTPSFSVNSDKQFYHCFGCGVSGDAIKFLQEYKHYDFVEAVEELASITGLEITYVKNDFVKKNQRASSTQKNAEKQKMQRGLDLLNAATDFYIENFNEDRFTQVRNYWHNRGFNYQIAKVFKIGFAEGNGLVQYLTAKGFSFDEIMQQGLLTQKENSATKEKFWQRLIFPIQDSQGNTLGFGGRVMQDSRMPKYLNSPETFLFDKSKILYGLHQVKTNPQKISRILITEGYLDVISLHQAGINYAVATMGTAISDFHIKQLLKISKNLVFCFDGDKAGFKAAQRALLAILPILNKIEEVRFLILEAGEDPDSIIKKQGKELFESRIDKAIPLVEFFLEFIGANSLDSNIDSKIKLVNNSIEYLARLPKDFYTTNFIINKVADLASTSVASIQAEIDKFVEKQNLMQRFSHENSKTQMALSDKKPATNATNNKATQNADYESSLESNFKPDYADFAYEYENLDANFTDNSSKSSNLTTATNSDAEKRNVRLVAETSYLLEVLVQKPSLAKNLDAEIIQVADALVFGVLSKMQNLAQKTPNFSQNDLLAYWHGTQIGDFLLKTLARSVTLVDLDEQFASTQKQMLTNLATEKLHKMPNNQDLTQDERNKKLVEQLTSLKNLKTQNSNGA